jgi:hypothetical protein
MTAIARVVPVVAGVGLISTLGIIGYKWYSNRKVMRLVLTRDILAPTVTLGTLKINGKRFGYTLEDTDRGNDQSMSPQEIWKNTVLKETAIPTGTYELGIHNSPSQGREVLHVLVPGYKYILIHSGSNPIDTEGCVLVGLSRDTVGGRIADSSAAVRWLETDPKGPMARLRRGERVTLTVQHKTGAQSPVMTAFYWGLAAAGVITLGTAVYLRGQYAR